MNQKILSMIGLAEKAGRVKTGAYQTDEAVKKGRAELVLIAGDASDRTKKSLTDMCKYYHIPFIIDGTKEDLSRAVGKTDRSSLVLTDRGFSDRIYDMLKEEETREGTFNGNSGK